MVNEHSLLFTSIAELPFISVKIPYKLHTDLGREHDRLIDGQDSLLSPFCAAVYVILKA